MNAHNPPPLDPITSLMPWAGPEDKPLRLRLHRAGARATARATRSKHGKARVLLWTIADMCHERTFARIDVAELTDTIAAISRLWLVVNFIERSEAADVDR